MQFSKLTMFRGAKVEVEPDPSGRRPLFADFVRDRKSGGAGLRVPGPVHEHWRRRPGPANTASRSRTALSRIWRAVSAFFS